MTNLRFNLMGVRHRPTGIVFAVVVSAIGAGGLSLSTLLPWYAVGGWHPLVSGTGPVSGFNALTLNWEGWRFGGRNWGFTLAWMGCTVIALAAIAGWSAMIARHHRAVRWCFVLSLAATGLLVVTLLEVNATPPFGDGPALSYTWGAVIGVLAAAVSAVGAWSALLISNRTSIMYTPPRAPSPVSSGQATPGAA